MQGYRHLLSSLTYIWPTKGDTGDDPSLDHGTEIKWAIMSICVLSFDSLFWKNHHELCGWHEWERPALLEVAGFHRRPQCTMTCYSSKRTNKQHVNIFTNAAQCLVAVVPAGDSPVCHSASCLQNEGGVHLSVWPSAVPDHSAHCSSPLWPMGQLKYVRHDLKERYKHSRGRTTHVVWKDISDGHKDSVFCSHRGQMQPELQITHRVTAEVLQLQTQTTKCSNSASSRFVEWWWLKLFTGSFPTTWSHWPIKWACGP